MPAGGCRGIFGVSFGRRQPMHHSCKKGNYYAQRRSVGLLHLRRASISPKSSSKQANPLIVGCVGFSSFVCVWFRYREGNLSGKSMPNNQGFYFCYILISV